MSGYRQRGLPLEPVRAGRERVGSGQKDCQSSSDTATGAAGAGEEAAAGANVRAGDATGAEGFGADAGAVDFSAVAGRVAAGRGDAAAAGRRTGALA
jgi:hypothetical protein